MQKFTQVEGIAAVLPHPNIDTDVIMPKQFLKGITRDDLARGLFYDLRFDPSGQERTDFILNQAPFRSSRFLIVGPNFGCGSSREHAVWGLVQFGIRAIIGTSFASIFHDNCCRNGLLPVVVTPASIERLQAICITAATACLEVDLVGQIITAANGDRIGFTVDALRRDDLLNGRDAIAATLQEAAAIDAFERCHWSKRPWLEPDA